MHTESNNGVLEEFRIEFLDCWHRLPNKGFFFGLLAAWFALFQFLGNSTFGYISTSSLPVWMYRAFSSGGLLESDEGYALLIPFVVLALYWVKRRSLVSLELGLWWPGAVIVMVGLLFHLMGYLVQQPRLSILGMFAGIYGLTGLAWGSAWLRATAFPFALLAFCMPLGTLIQPITLGLRLFVSQLVVFISHFILAIDVERDGTILMDSTRHYQYEVAAACSGIRSLVAIFVLALILAFVSLNKPWKRLLVIASSVPLAVLGNLVRMLAIIIAAELGGQTWGNRIHDGGPLGIFSLLPYVPAFIGLLILEHYLREPATPVSAAVLHEQQA